MPAGYIMGRLKGGKGPPQLVKVADLLAGGSLTGAATPSGGVPPGGGSGIEITDGVTDITGATKLTVTGGTVGGASPNATLTISGGGGSGLCAPLVTGELPGPIPIANAAGEFIMVAI